MPSGKTRKHNRNPGGRPSNQAIYEKQQAEIQRLRHLLSRKHHSDQTWHVIDTLLTVIEELEDMSTPQRSTTWDNQGHTAEQPILPGVHITDNGRIVHAGTYAAALNGWLHRTVIRDAEGAMRRLVGREPDPKPRPPRRVEIGSETQHG